MDIKPDQAHMAISSPRPRLAGITDYSSILNVSEVVILWELRKWSVFDWGCDIIKYCSLWQNHPRLLEVEDLWNTLNNKKTIGLCEWCIYQVRGFQEISVYTLVANFPKKKKKRRRRRRRKRRRINNKVGLKRKKSIPRVWSIYQHTQAISEHSSFTFFTLLHYLGRNKFC